EPYQRLDEVEQRVCDLASTQLGIPREKVSPGDRLIEDLHCDSLELVELFMAIEDHFGVVMPDRTPNHPYGSVYKAVFTRQPFRLADLAEVVYLRQGTGMPGRSACRRRTAVEAVGPSSVPFTQLGSRWEQRPAGRTWLWEPIEENGPVPQ